MGVRVIAGTAGGKVLSAPPGDRVRPTLDRVREALFSSLMNRVPGAAFLDLFAGSGANGIEALSRGAARAVFVDDHPQSLSCIRGNLARTGFEGVSSVFGYRLPGGLERVSDRFDVVFADPPYTFEDYEGLLRGVDGAALVAEGGVVVVEHERGETLPEQVGGLELERCRRYGNVCLSFYA